jgi:hypothetical protein
MPNVASHNQAKTIVPCLIEVIRKNLSEYYSISVCRPHCIAEHYDRSDVKASAAVPDGQPRIVQGLEISYSPGR